ncbi:MAG TPA: Tim44 domain-containing protein [Candidatus Methylomirabilis sp.]|nr:Tim44 domain-containing protein [Candidatus Methylomirabilis sp.]
MRRGTVVALLVVMTLVPLLWTAEALARVGGGSSGGSRGSRSYSAPVRPSSPSPSSPSMPASPSTPLPPAPQRPGWGGMLGGLVMGGLIGSLLFGGLGHMGGGGIGLLEIVILGGLVYFAFKLMRSRQPDAAPAGSAGSGPFGGGYSQSSYAGATMEVPASLGDLDRGIAHIRQMDPEFDPKRFAETASDSFFRMQAAWGVRDMGRASDVLTSEMQALLQKDCDRMRAEGRINRLENVAVRTAEVTEAWQERGQDYVTVHFLASLLDYTTDESGTRVLDGSRTEPVKFEEYWTFVRPVGPNTWRLSAIQQAT